MAAPYRFWRDLEFTYFYCSVWCWRTGIGDGYRVAYLEALSLAS
jgi:hypothetical protein